MSSSSSQQALVEEPEFADTLPAIETDDEPFESCSDYDTDDPSSTEKSYASSFTYENGRHYHDGCHEKLETYYMPNDEREQDRLDLYHHIFLSLMGGKLYTAPIENPKRILDVGTGTGIWAIDMADEHPQAEIIGTDLSPIQPSWVPPNCRFEVEDMEAEWPYEKNYFDMIHIRTLSGCVNDWDFVLRQAYKHLQPGGYIDFQDYGCELFLPDGTPAPDDTVDNCPLGYYVRVMNEAYLKIGRILQVAKHMKSWLENLGFLDVQEQRVIWPLGQWPKDPKLKELGKWGYIGACESLVPFALGLLTKMEGWTTQQVEDLAVRVKRDLGRGGGKYYCEGWFITARKPKRGEL